MTTPATHPAARSADAPRIRLSRGRAARIDAATSPDRDRVVDLVRGASMMVVALGHWLLAVITIGADGAVEGSNALAEVPVLQRLTWVLQVMPLFFLVGGVANAASWRSARDRQETWARWMHGRLARLVRPTRTFVLAWTGLAAALAATGALPPSTLALGATLVAVPVWFLAVYVVVVASSPAMLALHDRYGVAVTVALTALAAVIDAAHRAGIPVIGWTSFLVVWLVPQQLGFGWADGSLTRSRRTGPVLAVAGLLGLVLLTTVGPYPVSMVGVPGEAASNNSPPTPALIALAVFQLGLLLTARPLLSRWLARPRVWAAVVISGSRAMTVYLWHLTALVIVAVLLVRPGLLPVPAAGTGAWWVTRPLWIGVLLTVLVPLVAAFGRTEGAARPVGDVGAIRLVLGVAALCASFALLATDGFHVHDQPLGLPVPALVSGAVALTALPIRAR